MMGGDENGAARLSMTDPLPHLSTADLETLLAALDPRLEGFGEGENCLDDASAFLARLDLKDGRGGETHRFNRWWSGLNAGEPQVAVATPCA